MQDDIEAAFAAILEKIAKVNRDKIAGDKRLREDLGLDSHLLIDVAVAAEDAFGIRILDEDLERFQVVGDALDYIWRSIERLDRGGACMAGGLAPLAP
jgi:acyl carrier protein